MYSIKRLSDTHFDQLVDHFEPFIQQYAQLVLKQLENSKATDIQMARATKLAVDPVTMLKMARRDPKLTSLWSHLDIKIKSIFGI